MSEYGFWGGLRGLVKDFMVWLFPNGVGTRAVIAFIIIGVGITQLDGAGIKEVILLVLGFYFITKAVNGKPPATPK
jgi:hypothetical protein